MKKGLITLALCTFALTAASVASAHVDVVVGINPFGFGTYVAPPVVYQPAPYYAPSPAIYLGGGAWGGDRGRRDRDRDRGDHGRGGRGDNRRH
jgi:hypothetical protein